MTREGTNPLILIGCLRGLFSVHVLEPRTPGLKNLHWLPVKHRVFITVTQVYQFLKKWFS